MTAPKTLYDKIWDAHVAHEADDGTTLLYIDRHLVLETFNRVVAGRQPLLFRADNQWLVRLRRIASQVLERVRCTFVRINEDGDRGDDEVSWLRLVS